MASRNKWYIGKAVTAMKVGAYRGLKEWADIVLDTSQALVPVDIGELETSGKVSGDNGSLTVAVFYDTGNLYAIRQHEDTSLNHPNGGQAKYLEQPFNELAPLLQSVLADEIKKEIAG